LPKIYEEVTGEVFQDPRPGAGNQLWGSDEWEVLHEICNPDTMHLELMSKLIGTEYQYHTKSRRIGVYDALEKCFESSSRSQEQAIENAHYKRDLKTAAKDGDVYAIKQLKNRDMKPLGTEGDVAAVKQLSWGTMKYPTLDNDDDDVEN